MGEKTPIIFINLLIGLFIVVLIVFPIVPPLFINSIYGITIMVLITFLLFIYTNPILGILFIIACYVLLLRTTQKKERIQQTQQNTNYELKQMNNTPNNEGTLEEQMINILQPIVPINKPVVYLHSQFKPINESIGTASML
jgi:Ca2+/Na+ antiporter